MTYTAPAGRLRVIQCESQINTVTSHGGGEADRVLQMLPTTARPQHHVP